MMADALLVTPLYSFLRSRLRSCAPPRPGDSTPPTFVLGSPRTPAFRPETGTRPSLPAGRPAARTRPSPLARYTLQHPKAWSATSPRPEHASGTRNADTRPHPKTRPRLYIPLLGSPKTPSDSGLGRRLDPKASTLTLLDELGDDRTLEPSRPLLRPKLEDAPESTPRRLAGGRTHGLGDLPASGPGEVNPRTRDASE
jgi:hypothetical protein